MVVLKTLRDSLMHFTKLGTVALIKNQHHMFLINIMLFIFTDEYIQLLNSGYNDFVFMRISFFIPVLQLSLKNSCGRITISCPFFKTIIFFHGLIIQVFTVNNEQYLVYIRQGRS